MNKHLENLTVHRFRGLRDLELSELGNANLFVGENNSGKTSLLEAVSTYCRPLDPFEWLDTSWRREIKSSRTPMLDALKWLFPQEAVAEGELYSGSTFISGSGNFPVLESRASLSEFMGIASSYEPEDVQTDAVREREPLFEIDSGRRSGADLELRVVPQEVQPTLSDREPKREISETFRVWEHERFISRKRYPYPWLPVDTISPVSHRVEQIQIKRFTEVTLEGVKMEALQLAHLIDPGIEDLKILSKQGIRPTLYIHHKEVGLAPLSAFGDGVRRTLMMALTIPLVQGGVLLIDEIETAIHTSVLTKVFSWLVSACALNHVQLFATTHSLEAVDAMLDPEAGDSNGVVVFRLKRAGQPAQRYSGDLLHRLRYESGLDVR